MCLYIDNIKSFNDRYGHDYGDEFVIVEPNIDIKEFALKLDHHRNELNTIKTMDKQFKSKYLEDVPISSLKM